MYYTFKTLKQCNADELLYLRTFFLSKDHLHTVCETNSDYRKGETSEKMN